MEIKNEIPIVLFDDECYVCIKFASIVNFFARGKITMVGHYSNFGKKIMHNKFCIIDFKKVIHGSYNWTNNAKYNNESITITESRELAEEFAEQFIKLKVNIKNPEKNSK